MIQAISGFSARSSFFNAYKEKHNYTGSMMQVSFRGAPALARNVAGSRTIARFAEESKDMLTGSFRKLTRRNQLPVVKKPVVTSGVLDPFLDGTPVGGGFRVINGIRKSDDKQVAVGLVSVADNTLGLGVKTAAVAKAAGIGMAVAGPPGALIGAAGTLIVWGITRNAIVKSFFS